MKNFKACLVAKFENNTAKYVYVVISNSYLNYIVMMTLTFK